MEGEASGVKLHACMLKIGVGQASAYLVLIFPTANQTRQAEACPTKQIDPLENLSRCATERTACIMHKRSSMKIRQISRKLQAILALLALLVASVPTLAESLSASDLPACCNTSYCPLHHRQGVTFQQDKTDCGAHGQAAGNDCSMRACDAAPNPAVGTALFVLVTPIAIVYRSSAEPAPILVSRFFPVSLNIPSTPPPRTLPS